MKPTVKLTRPEVLIVWLATLTIIAMCLRPPSWHVAAGACQSLTAVIKKLDRARSERRYIRLYDERSGRPRRTLTLEEIRRIPKPKPGSADVWDYAKARYDNVIWIGDAELYDAEWELGRARSRPGLRYHWLWSLPAHVDYGVLAFQSLLVLVAAGALVFGLRQLAGHKSSD